MSGDVVLADLAPDAARRAVAAAPVVWVFVNPVEYHGPHLPLHTDKIISEGLARGAHAQLFPEAPFVIGADLEMGVDPCPGPGTRAWSYPDVARAVTDTSEALASLGVTRAAFMTFHGSPLHESAIEQGCSAIRRAGGRALNPFNIVLEELAGLHSRPAERFAEAVAHIDHPATRRALLDDMPVDFHAGFLETSLVMHTAPSCVSASHASLPPCPPLVPDPALLTLSRVARRAGRTRVADELMVAALGTAWRKLRPFPGYSGKPHLASAVAGAAFSRLITARYVEALRDVLLHGGRAPPPIMRWLPAFSLRGRIGAGDVPLGEIWRLPQEPT